MEQSTQITVDDIKDHHVVIMQKIHLPSLLPILEKKGALSPSDIERVSDSKHHGSIERTGFLLHSLYKEGQKAIDAFVDGIRSSREILGHKEILQLLVEGEPELPSRSPLFDILDENLDVIERQINLTAFLNALTHSGALKVTYFLDLQNPDRSVRDNLSRLITVLDKQGSRGFINFMSCLYKESDSSHEKLFDILFQHVKTFFKQNPRREEVESSDRIELLQMETRDIGSGVEFQRRIKQHKDQLISEINYPVLLPYLQKHRVLSREDTELLDKVKFEQQNADLVRLLDSKGPSAAEKFVQSLKDCTSHQRLHKLLVTSSGLPQTHAIDIHKRTALKHDKVAVIVCMEKYLIMNEYYKAEEKNYGDYVKENKHKLEQYLETLGFNVIFFSVNCEGSPLEQRKESELKQSATDTVTEKFQKEVVSKCNEGAIVFIYISGIQFPYKEVRDNNPHSWHYNGAILRAGVSKSSRKLAECIVARQLLHWVELLPKAFVTFLIDTHQSHVHEFGKQRQPKVVEILEDPWEMLTPMHSNTVVYFLRPDPIAMSRLQVDEKEIGKLSANFVEVLLSSYMRKPEGISHRAFYEGISFLWHKQGREHKLFVPAVQGDIDREFLGKDGLPYQQFFRADLKKHSNKFNLDELQIATGTMARLILGDQLEIFHVLRPSVRVSGIVTQAHPLDCTAKVLDERHGKAKLTEVLHEVYQDKDRALQSQDGSTEFLHVKKKFPLHERVPVCLEGLKSSESETIKSYIKAKSVLLSFVTSNQEAKIVVKHSGQYFVMEDLNGDVKYDAKARTVQHVKSLLEMIAWYKYVKKLKSDDDPPSMKQLCFLTAEKRLLSQAVPHNTEFSIKWSSFRKSPDTDKDEPNPNDAILQFLDVLKFWSPQPNDTSPCLEVEFKQNHVLTAIEIRGDPRDEENRVKNASIYYQRNVMRKSITGPSKDEVTVFVDVKKAEAVRFITIEPKEWGETFNLTFKMKKKLISAGKASVGNVNSVTIVHWQFHKQRQTPWKCIPTPDILGNVNLDQAMCWMSWSGSTFDPITFDLGQHGVQLVKLEFTAPSELFALKKFVLRLQTDWIQKDLKPIASVWPTKVDFKRPTVVSNFQLWPKLTGEMPHNLKVQMQIYGNKHGYPIEVEEGDILTFYFENFTARAMFVYIFCLEETGNVKFVTWDIAHPSRESPLQKLLQAYIPEGYNPTTGQITDLYKVFVSARKMYLEPFIQRGLHQYHQTCCYSVCSLGHKLDIGNEPWYEYQFTVIVNKSPSYS